VTNEEYGAYGSIICKAAGIEALAAKPDDEAVRSAAAALRAHLRRKRGTRVDAAAQPD
jgi:hypothetical protein